MVLFVAGKCKPGTFPGHPHKRGKRSLTHQENGGDKEEKRGSSKETRSKDIHVHVYTAFNQGYVFIVLVGSM